MTKPLPIKLLLLLMPTAFTLALTSALAQTPTPEQPTDSQSNAQATPTPTLGDHFTQVLSDRQVIFRFFAPKAAGVDVVLGLKSGPYELQGSTTTAMTKDAAGLWSRWTPGPKPLRVPV
jgi:hypothetical protein